MADDMQLKGAVIDAVGMIEDPVSKKTLLDAHMVEDVVVQGGEVTVKIAFPANYPKDERWVVEDNVHDAVEKIGGATKINVVGFVQGQGAGAPPAAAAAGHSHSHDHTHDHGHDHGHSHEPAKGLSGKSGAVPASKSLEGVGRVIAVASGKGGVGKSTVAVNLALALQRLGYRTGLLDIDIYGPSLPTLLGINERPNVKNKRIVPPEIHGMKVMSLGFLMEDDTPVIWRGPIVTGIIRQFLQDVDWNGLDYLVVDMPPGTGDAQLSLAQTVPVDGAVVVTTPSDLALVDAARGLRMFNTLNVDVLGIVENMAWFQWPGAAASHAAIAKLKASGADAKAVAELETALSEHERVYIFGREGGRREATRLGTPFLGEIPLDERVRYGGDNGKPVVISDPDGAVAKAFSALAEKVAQAKPVEREAGAGRKGLFSFLKA